MQEHHALPRLLDRSYRRSGSPCAYKPLAILPESSTLAVSQTLRLLFGHAQAPAIAAAVTSATAVKLAYDNRGQQAKGKLAAVRSVAKPVPAQKASQIRQ